MIELPEGIFHANADNDPMQGQICADTCYNSCGNVLVVTTCSCYCHLRNEGESTVDFIARLFAVAVENVQLNQKGMN